MLMEKEIINVFVYDNIKINEGYCPDCGRSVPCHIAICWNCGQVLDKQLIKLIKLKESKNH
jgi:hypothetical protein